MDNCCVRKDLHFSRWDLVPWDVGDCSCSWVSVSLNIDEGPEDRRLLDVADEPLLDSMTWMKEVA